MEIILGAAVLGMATASLAGAEAAPGGISGAPDGMSTGRAMWVVKIDTRSGRLVRTLVAPKPTDGSRANVRSLVAEAARSFDVNPLLVDSVIQVESNYNPFAVSAKGAQGLMQLMPTTAQRFGVTDSFDPKQNIEAGVRYLRFLQDTFQDDRLAIAAYNAGEKAVAKYKDVPPYPETMSYVAKVGKKYGQGKRATTENEARRDGKNVEEPKATEDRANEAPRHILAYVDPEGRLHMATR